MRTIYNSLIHPHLIYGLYLWGFSPTRLTVLQKKAVRILSLRPYVSHSTPLFKNLKILKIKDQYSIQLYKLYYKNTNNLLPHYFNSFTPYYNNEEHGHTSARPEVRGTADVGWRSLNPLPINPPRTHSRLYHHMFFRTDGR